MGQSNKGFFFFYDWEEPFENLDGNDFKEIFLAMMRYQKDGTPPPEFTGMAKIVAAFVFPQLERRKMKAEAGRAGMQSRWHNEENDSCNEKNDNDNNNSDSVDNSVNNKDVTLIQRQIQRQGQKTNTETIDKDVDKDKDKDTRGIILPFADGFFAVDNAAMEKYKKDYPFADVDKELSEMKNWLENTDKVKLKADAVHFICGWLKKENQKAALTITQGKQNHSPPENCEPSHSAEEFFNAAVAKSMGNTT